MKFKTTSMSLSGKNPHNFVRLMFRSCGSRAGGGLKSIAWPIPMSSFPALFGMLPLMLVRRGYLTLSWPGWCHRRRAGGEHGIYH
jgi:hypothetical protein